MKLETALEGRLREAGVLIFTGQQRSSLGFLFSRQADNHQPSLAVAQPGRQGLGLAYKLLGDLGQLTSLSGPQLSHLYHEGL